MTGPGQSVCYHPQELGAADSLHCYVVNEEWCVTGLTPPKVDDDLLGFVDIQGQVVGFAPVHQMFHLLFVGSIVVLTDKAHYCHANFTIWLLVDLAQQS